MRAIVRDPETTAFVERDYAGLPAQAVELSHCRGYRDRRRPALELLHDARGQKRPHDAFPIARESRGPDVVIRIEAAPGNRGISDATWRLPRQAAGRCRDREIAVPIPRHASDGIMVAAGVDRGCTIMAFDPARRSEGLGAFRHQQHGPLGEQEARDADRVPNATDRGDSADIESPTVHDRGVHLDVSGGSRNRAAAGVERLIIFKLAYRPLDGLGRRATLLQDCCANSGRRCTSAAVSLLLIGGNGPGSAMNDQRPARFAHANA